MPSNDNPDWTLPPVAFRRIGLGMILASIARQREFGPSAGELVQAEADTNASRPQVSGVVEFFAAGVTLDLNEGNLVISAHFSLSPSFPFFDNYLIYNKKLFLSRLKNLRPYGDFAKNFYTAYFFSF